MIKLSNLFINFIKVAIEKDTNTSSMEVEVLTNTFDNIFRAEGINKLYYVVLYCVLTYYELKFFIMYIFRVFKVFIMMVISPLMSITYPIDYIADGKAQGFRTWFKKLAIQIFIQPIHLIIYIIFVYSAGEIAKAMPIVAIFFLMFLDNGEKIIRRALKLDAKGSGLKEIKIGKGKK